MTLSLLRKDRNPIRKPTSYRRPNLRHLFLKHCVGAWYFIEGKGVPFNYIDRSMGSFVGTGVSWNVGDTGHALDFNAGAGTDRLDLGTIPASAPLTLSANNEATFLSRVFYRSNTNTFPRIIDKSNSGSGANGWAFYYEYSGTDEVVVAVNGGVYGVVTTLTAGNYYNVAASAVGGSGSLRVFVDGSFIGTNTVVNSFPTTSTPAAIGNWNHTSGRMWPGLIQHVLVFDVALPDALLLKIERDPFRPFERRVWVPVTTAGTGVTEVLTGVEGTAGIGTLVATGGGLVVPTGVEGAGQVGALAAVGGGLANLVGVEGTGQLGTLVATGGVTLVVTGVSGTGQVGEFTVVAGGSVQVELAGVEGASQLGSPVVLTGAVVPLEAIQSTGQVGTLQVAGGTVLLITGVEGTSQVGVLNAGQFTIVELTGVSGTGEIGTLNLVTGAVVGLPSVSAVSNVGVFDVSASLTLTLTGVGADGAVGTINVNVTDFVVTTPSHRIYTLQEDDRTYLIVEEDRNKLIN